MSSLALTLVLAGNAIGSEEVPAIDEHFSAPAPPSDAARQRESALKLAVATHPELAATWADLGWRLYKDDRYPECYVVMKQAHELAPTDPYVLWLSGLAAFSVGHWSEAADYLWPLYRDYEVPALRAEEPPYLVFEVRMISESHGAVDLSSPLPPQPSLPSSIDAAALYEILGRSELSRGEFFMACVVLGAACELEPKDWRPFFFLGYAECQRARLDPTRYLAAETALGRARELNPDQPLVLRFYAYAKSLSQIELSSDTDLNDAAAAVKQAIAVKPDDVANYNLLTQVRLAQLDTAAAIAAARKALALNNDDGYSLYLLAKSLLAAGGDDGVSEAKRLLARSMAVNPGLMDGTQTAPHAGLLISTLLNEGNVQAAESLTSWCIQNGFAP